MVYAHRPFADPLTDSEQVGGASWGRGAGHSALHEVVQLYEEAIRGTETAAVCAILEGKSSLGKTNLLQDFRGRVRLAGGVVLEGRCDLGQPYAPFAGVVEQALRFLDEVGAGASLDLRGLACRDGCHRFWYQHAGAARTGFACVRTLEAAEQRARFFGAVAAVLSEVARIKPPAVLVYDLDRADESTLHLLRFLTESGPPGCAAVEGPFFVLASMRGEGVVGADALPNHRRIRVDSLDDQGLRDLLQSPQTLRRIMERTGGVPEAVERLLEGDPLSPAAHLERRLTKLGPAYRGLLEALAVLGRPARSEELQAIADTRLDDAQAVLSSCDVLSRVLQQDAVLFRFTLPSDAELIRTRLGADERMALHRACARVAAQAGRNEEAVQHALFAQDFDLATDHAVLAAAALTAGHAHTEAAKLLERVVERRPEPAPDAIREELCSLYQLIGDYPAALRHLEALVAKQPECARRLGRLGQLLTLAGEFDRAEAVLLDAYRLGEGEAADADPKRRAERVALEAHLAEVLYQKADYRASKAWTEKALSQARSRGLLALEIEARNILGKLYLAQDDADEASALFEENRRRAAHAGFLHEEAQAHTNLGISQLMKRALPEATRTCLRAIDVATRCSDTRDRAIATENLAAIAHVAHDFASALEHYRKALHLLRRLGNQAMVSRILHNIGELYATLGDFGQATRYAEHADHPDLPRSVRAEGLLLRGRVAAGQGLTKAARAAFEGARTIFDQLASPRSTEASIELARTALLEDRPRAARSLVAALPRPAGAVEQALIALVLAEADRQEAGRNSVQSAQRAVEAAVRSEDPELRLMAHMAEAKALVAVGRTTEAAEATKRAEEIEVAMTAAVPPECANAWGERPLRRSLLEMQERLSTSPLGRRSDSRPPPPPDTRQQRQRYRQLVGSSAALDGVRTFIDKVAATDALVLVRGESGTGKELIAQAIHDHSKRSKKPLIKVNCAALVESLLLSELLGHEKGAFTGANCAKKGRFELADGGTLFLDEIGDISPKTQVALLRVLQEKEFERVGGTDPIRVDVRILTATHRNLEEMVREGTFREDLYYRLRGVVVEVPPLRERPEDLPELCQHLLDKVAAEQDGPAKSVGNAALDALRQHAWPGNVRELENVLRAATLFAEGPVLMPKDFRNSLSLDERPASAPPAMHIAPRSLAPKRPPEPNATHPGDHEPPLETLLYQRVRDGHTSLFDLKKQMERECIERALLDTGGNITRAAELLGMKRPRLSQLVKQYELLRDRHGG